MLYNTKYNRLTILEVFKKEVFYGSFVKPRNIFYAKTLCDCGTVKEIRLGDIKTGNTKSCGCLIKDNPDRKTSGTHRLTKTPEYRTLVGMKIRCYNPKCKSYIDYGAKGITVCERWLEKDVGIINFIEDMGHKPGDNYSIDRIDSNQNYSKENCRWVTIKEQSLNKKNNLKIIYKGEQRLFMDVLLEKNMLEKVIMCRKRYARGWNGDKIFDTPANPIRSSSKRKKDIMVEYMGGTVRFWEILEKLNLKHKRAYFYKRLKKNIPFEESLNKLNLSILDKVQC